MKYKRRDLRGGDYRCHNDQDIGDRHESYRSKVALRCLLDTLSDYLSDLVGQLHFNKGGPTRSAGGAGCRKR